MPPQLASSSVPIPHFAGVCAPRSTSYVLVADRRQPKLLRVVSNFLTFTCFFPVLSFCPSTALTLCVWRKFVE